MRINAITVATLAAAALASAGVASAAPSGPGNAQDVIDSLKAQGYNVQINGTADSAMTECMVTGVHGLSNNDSGPTTFTTAYVDISCPDDH